MHREVQIKHDLMTRECKYTLCEKINSIYYSGHQCVLTFTSH